MQFFLHKTVFGTAKAKKSTTAHFDFRIAISVMKNPHGEKVGQLGGEHF